ncbi:hypothetical protein JW911_03410 [Candidatus Peregrinibacteria bacterium]|nr:hypothetical protein [Candidatus Peregrinibacteria bacterium]
MKKSASIALLSALFIIAFAGCQPETQKNVEETAEDENKPAETQKTDSLTLEQAATTAITALKNEDMILLSSLASEKGVRFSPYAYINIDTDVVLEPEVLKNVQALSSTFVWGSYDGSGEPIDLPFGWYYEKFVYSKDFLNAPEIKYNEIIGRGNSINNLKEVYLNAEFSEYHFPGFDPQYEGMDWESLRLVFEKENNEYRLVGIIHDGWTI